MYVISKKINNSAYLDIKSMASILYDKEEERRKHLCVISVEGYNEKTMRSTVVAVDGHICIKNDILFELEKGYYIPIVAADKIVLEKFDDHIDYPDVSTFFDTKEENINCSIDSFSAKKNGTYEDIDLSIMMCKIINAAKDRGINLAFNIKMLRLLPPNNTYNVYVENSSSLIQVICAPANAYIVFMPLNI